MNKLRSIVISAAMVLTIGVQCMVPVQAAEAAPMSLVKCSCGTAMNVDVQSISQGKVQGPVANCSVHLDCKIYQEYFFVSERYLCPSCGASKAIRSYYEWRDIHRPQ